MNNEKSTILVVEDDMSSMALLRTILDTGSNLLEATTGAQALSLATENKLDVVLIDLELPDITGLEVCRRIKAMDGGESIPVLFLTAHDDILLESQAFKAGAVDYIVKPVSPLRVLIRLNAHIKNKVPMELLN